MNPFKVIYTWANLYHSIPVFLGHKLTHVGVGGIVTLLACVLGHPYIGLGLCLLVAIGKEVADHQQLKLDPTNPIDKIEYHTLDVIVTCLGGIATFASWSLIGGVTPTIITGVICMLLIVGGMMAAGNN